MKNILIESKKAAKIVGIEERTLRYWATTKIITPAQDAQGRPGKRRLYSFENLVEAAILRELNKQRITISLAGKAITAVKDKKYGNQGQAISLLLIVGGNKIDFLVSKIITDEFNYKDSIKVLEEFSGVYNTYLPKSRKGLARLVPALLTEEELQEKIMKMQILLGLSFFAKLFRRTIEEKEAVLIIPVHKLWNEIEEKVKKGG